MEPVLINGLWSPAQQTGSFRAFNPATGEILPPQFPVSGWGDCDAVLAAATAAAAEMAILSPAIVSSFLDDFARRLDERATTICEVAQLETALPLKPRLLEVEMPRTTRQLRLAAAAALDASWRTPTIDTVNNLRSYLAPIGPVAVFGPNNFPLAFNGISGGDFAAAIAAGNPVIAKANPAHPRTTQLLAQEALSAAQSAGLPSGAVQLLYMTSNDDGWRLARDPRLAAVAFTGSRPAGMALKAAADSVGKPIYLEMSSVNPVFMLPGAIRERRLQLVDELAGSCLLGSGQFCTCPNLIVLLAGEETEAFLAELQAQFAKRPPGPLLSVRVLESLRYSIDALRQAGADLVTGGRPIDGSAYRFENTLLRASGAQFLDSSAALQTEAFGNATLVIVVESGDQACEVAAHVEGSLTASLYTAADGSDDPWYDAIAPILRQRVGRLLNDRMPTGVAVSPAMNHGGPYPATGHPGFTSVGIPASLRRFTMLQCYDNVRPHRLPALLQSEVFAGTPWRSIDGVWTQGPVPTS